MSEFNTTTGPENEEMPQSPVLRKGVIKQLRDAFNAAGFVGTILKCKPLSIVEFVIKHDCNPSLADYMAQEEGGKDNIMEDPPTADEVAAVHEFDRLLGDVTQKYRAFKTELQRQASSLELDASLAERMLLSVEIQGLKIQLATAFEAFRKFCHDLGRPARSQ